MPTTEDDDLAARLADEAGHVLVALRTSMGLDDARALGTEGDRRSNELIMDALGMARPDDGVLSEEEDRRPGHPDRASVSRVWIIDPLDGTREQSEGRADFAVHVALVVDGSPMVGAVALPGEGIVLVTGARRSRDRALAPLPRALADRREPHPTTGGSRARRGPARGAARAHGLSRGQGHRRPTGLVDAYIHSGGQYEWDSAAPVAVAHAYGAFAARLDGSPLVYNRADPWLPDLLVCRPELSSDVLDARRR